MLRSNEVIDEQFWNINLILPTLEVIKLFPNVIEVNDRHSLNRGGGGVTSAVLKKPTATVNSTTDLSRSYLRW